MSLSIRERWRCQVGSGPPPKMTLATFCSLLRQTPRTWCMEECHWLRDAKHDCPIVAVCVLLTGQNFRANWYEAARVIGLPGMMATRIVEAADGRTRSTVRQKLIGATIGRTPTVRASQGRNGLTHAAGVESPQATEVLVGAASE